MGIGHSAQLTFTKRRNPLSYGGELRKKKLGRGQRPLSTKSPIHVVFKTRRIRLRHRSLRSPHCFKLINSVIRRYSRHFTVKVEQLSIQHDHLHMLIRTSRRRNYLDYFRVVAGQIAQCFEKEGLLMTDTPLTGLSCNRSLWKHRPFSRVVVGAVGYRVIRNYIQLNEKEVLGKIPYRKTRLRGLSSADWALLWR